MNNKKSRYASDYALKFALFCIVCAVLTLILSALIFKFDSRTRGVLRDTVGESSSLSPLTVVIDAGHGGEDGGASGITGELEKDLNLKISFLIADMLRANGVNVIMTRSEDILLYDPDSDYHGRKKLLDLTARLDIARATENSVFVSIHMNAFPQTQYSGLQVYYSKNDPRSKIIADTVQNNVKMHIQPENSRRTKGANSSIFLLDRLETPAVLIECGFLSNPTECKALSNSEYQRDLAFVIFCSLMDYISNNNS